MIHIDNFYIGFNKENRIEIIKLSIVTVLLSVILFVPAMNKYGMAFFDYTDQFPYPNLPKFMYKATLGVFGLIGCVALLLIFIKKYNINLTRIIPVLLIICGSKSDRSVCS